MRRADICLYLGPADRADLQALLTNRNTPRKLAWRADIVLATADGQGTVEIMRRTGMSKPTVWRWQERYLDEGVPGLKRDKTRPSRVPPLPREVRLKVIAKTVQETPPNTPLNQETENHDPNQGRKRSRPGSRRAGSM
ncbi:helix-turn-helix domain-containing protein [Sediminimonas qiaohouensis]|uniref:helix-turn-helix domain-containing protein n=1 Tax=Sediminimonas qiaohouensis TaxID=552061 RepID=UPI003B5B5783